MQPTLQPSASYSFILRTETSDRPGMLGRVTTAIGEEGGDIGAIDIVRVGGGKMVRDLTVAARDEAHAEEIVQRVRALDGVSVLHVTDRTFLVHLGGKIEVDGRVPVKSARRPEHGLHARCRAHLPGDSRRSRANSGR